MKPAEERVEEAFVTGVRALADVEGGGAAARLGGLAPAQARAVLEDMIYSRQADLAARRLRADGRGYYTIASAGHEANAVVAAALRPDDPALLHYRSGAFFLHRARMAREAGGPEVDALRSILLGVVAARDEPIAGGRHKVLGSAPLWVLPQTSTIASQLPRALGMAFAMRQRARLRQAPALPEDAVVICSLGDASMAHSTAAGALQAAGQIAHRGLPLPLVVVCEDNGLGI
ncbi:MAG: hypothetical protein KC636_19045, partial [Myxococcales bacterium]|nr:hypothetical protein [Myxococcales bacterium]